MKNKLLSFGHGYSAQALESLLSINTWTLSATTRNFEKAQLMRNRKISTFIWPGENLKAEIFDATHILLSIPPDSAGDPIFNEYGDIIAQSENLKWVGYLSTTGVMVITKEVGLMRVPN